jgi:outer membrane protein insertion porin family
VKLISFLIASSFCFASAFATPISEVKTTGLKRIERDAVLAKIVSKVGTEYKPENVRTDIETLYGMGYFDDIVISKEDKPTSVSLTYDFKERPVINEVLFEGNEKVSTSDLEDAAKVKKWAILDINKVQADIELLQKLYEDKGYYLAKITYEVRPDKDGEVKLVYKFADYDKVEVKRIVFLNNHAFNEDKLKGVFAETKEGSSLNFLSSSGTFKESSFKTDLQRLTYWYLEHGYVKFRFENPVITISDDKKYVFISVFVDEGLKYQIGTYDFSGDLLFSKDELRKEVKLLPGQDFSISVRNADIQRLTEKYQDLGYAFANVVPKMDINDETKLVNIDYSFEKGNLVHFGEIHIIGNSKTYDKVIRRELRIYEGELFSGSQLRISKERVERLGFFAPGEVQFNQVPRRGRDDIVDIDIQIKERSTGSVTVGAGYSSVQGFFFQGKVAEINLFGRGQSLSLDGQFGNDQNSRSISLSFFEPYAWDSKWSAGADLFMSNSEIIYRYLIRRTGFNLKTGYPITDDIQAYFTYKFEFLQVLTSYDSVTTAAATGTPLAPGAPNIVVDSSLDKGILSSAVFSVVRDKRNNRFETTGGNYQNASFEFAGLGGVKNFGKVVLNNRYYNNFVEEFVFKNSTEAGVMIDTGGRGIPPSESFYLGGPWNLRGFEAYNVSPVISYGINANGNPTVQKIGGSSEFYSLFEIEHPLIKDAGMKWVVFYDIGNAFAGVPGIDKGKSYALRQDYGFGIRWFSPLGPLRFEWSFPVNRQIDPMTGSIEDGSQFIFFIGTPF